MDWTCLEIRNRNGNGNWEGTTGNVEGDGAIALRGILRKQV
jgi:hypothetical protein